MKNFFDKLKNKFGLGEEEHMTAPATASTQTPVTPPQPAADDHSKYLPRDPQAEPVVAASPSPEPVKREPAYPPISTVNTPAVTPAKETAIQPAGGKPSPKKTFFPESAEKREAITSFIVNSLKPYVDETGISISALRLYIVCADNAAQETARIALHADKPGYFRAEKLERKLQNNFIQLSDNWNFSYELVSGQLPDCIFKKGDLGLDVFINQHSRHHRVLATLRVLTGQTASDEYVLDSSANKHYCIGRGFQPQLASGKLHTNDIVFLNREDPGFDEHRGKQNLYVSRDHAVIAFNPSFNRFLLYADKGGLPESGNKTKIFKANNKIERVDIAEIGHELRNGDQIELGGGAKLLFIENE